LIKHNNVLKDNKKLETFKNIFFQNLENTLLLSPNEISIRSIRVVIILLV